MELLTKQPLIKHTHWVLIGAIWYLLEWAFIIPFGIPALSENAGTEELAQFFTSNAYNVPIYSIGIGLTILGKLMLISALRYALRNFERARLPLDFAFACAILAVAVETVAYGFDMVAIHLGTYGSAPPLDVAAGLVGASYEIQKVMNIPHGLFTAAAALAMLSTRSLPRWVGWLGLVAGLGFALSVNWGPMIETFQPIRVNLQVFSWIGIAIWMLAAGVILFRRPAKEAALTIEKSLHSELS
jgi:hypothetical protein